jgi:hypothetical protein
MRELFQILEDQFDAENKRYKGSGSDETISKVIGLSVTFVSKVRAEAFGEIGPDPRIAKLETDLTVTYDVLVNEVHKLEQKIKSEYEAIRTRLNGLKGV